jgi:hypothetical protein
MAWGGRQWPVEGGDGLRRASSCERRCHTGCGGGSRPAECRGVRRRPAGGGKGASDYVGQRGLRPTEGSEGFLVRRAGGRLVVLRAGGGVLRLMAKALCKGVIWGEVFFP